MTNTEMDIEDFGEMLVEHALLAFSPTTPVANSKRKEQERNYFVGMIRLVQGVFLTLDRAITALSAPKKWTHRVYEETWSWEFATERLREKLQTLERTHEGLAEYQVVTRIIPDRAASIYLIIAKLPA